MKPRVIRCPACQKKTEYAPINPFRPFCSQRCKQSDIASWASESYAIPSEEAPAPNPYLDDQDASES